MTSKEIVSIEQEVNATEQEVFDAFTKAHQLEKWFATKAETNLEGDGKYWFSFEYNESRNAALRNHTRSGKYIQLIPNQSIVFTWLDRTLVNIILSKTDKGTKIELTHSGWIIPQDDDLIESHLEGWMDFLSNLQSVLEKGIDMRPKTLGMRTKEYPSVVSLN